LKGRKGLEEWTGDNRDTVKYWTGRMDMTDMIEKKDRIERMDMTGRLYRKDRIERMDMIDRLDRRTGLEGQTRWIERTRRTQYSMARIDTMTDN
jgi:hypothetical protein